MEKLDYVCSIDGINGIGGYKNVDSMYGIRKYGIELGSINSV